ncbi:MAG: helix-hairpin-helix domain-containing protein [Armatimonadetes bacterium]|nr:helix-hairpin-helix domain-containing protein [Armatimonadota bacterium]
MDENSGVALTDIPGLGPKRLAALRDAGIRELRDLLAIELAELAAIRGIGQWHAQRIREHLRQLGLVVEVETAGGERVLAAVPHTPAELAVVEAAAAELERQAEVEARKAAEVEMLGEVLAEAEAATAAEPGGEASVPEDTGADPAGGQAAEPPAEAPETPPWANELQEARHQLPETALALLEAIRQAAVSRQLTRQLTRLLITTNEFLSAERGLGNEARKAAADAVSSTDQALRRALERRNFSVAAQKELARRIRRRRKELENLLGPE